LEEFRLSSFGLAIFACFVAFTAVFFHVAPGKFPADDGFFYLQIAANIASGNGSTFNGIMPTNGYHPLWMVFCVLSALISGSNKPVMMSIVWLFQVSLFISSLFLLKSVFFAKKELEDRESVDSEKRWAVFFIAGAVLTLIFLGSGTLYFTEAFLNLFFIMLCLFFIKNYEYSTRNAAIFGALIGLLTLSRLDNIVVAPILALAYLYKYNTLKIKPFAIVAAAGAFTVVPYLVWNLFEFGALMPISGSIKSYFPSLFIGSVDIYGKATGAITFFYIIFLFVFYKKREGFILRLAVAEAAAAHFLWNAAFQSAIGQWYWIWEYVAVALFAADIVYFLATRKSGREWIYAPYIMSIIPLLILMFALAFSVIRAYFDFSFKYSVLQGTKIERSSTDDIEALAYKLNKYLQPGDRVFVWDSPGKLAYYSKMAILPSDGLVSNHEYVEYIKRYGVPQYLKEHNVKYMLLPYSSLPEFDYSRLFLTMKKVDGGYKLDFTSPVDNASCGSLMLNSANLCFIEPSPRRKYESTHEEIALWKLMW
jgi:hypothetical protein